MSGTLFGGNAVAPQTLEAITSAAQQIESACLAFQQSGDHSAEKFLIEFRSVANPYLLCRFIIEKSSNAQAVFQALCCIREAVIRDWPSLPPENKAALQEFLLQSLLNRPNDPVFQPYVQTQVAHVLAVIQKRGWPETKPISPFLSADSILASNNPDKASGLFMTLRSIIQEFTINKSSKFGFTMETHFNFRLDFQSTFLKGAFTLSLNFLLHCAQRPFASNTAEYRAIHRCIQLVSEILNWEFIQEGSRFRPFVPFNASTQLSRFQPPNDWKVTVLNEPFLQMIFQYARMYRNSQMEQTLWEVISQLTSLTGPVFDNDVERTAFVRIMAMGLLSMSNSPEVLSANLNILPLISQALVRLIQTQQLKVFVNLGQDFPVFLQTFINVAYFCLSGASQSLDDTDFIDTFDTLIGGAVWIASGASSDPTLLPYIIDPLLNLYERFVSFKFQRATALINCDIDDTDEIADSSVLDEQLVGIASIGRLSPARSMALLSQILERCLVGYQRFSAQGTASGINIVEIHEHMNWLLLFLGHLIADSDSDGEEPSIPTFIDSWMAQSSVKPFIDIINVLLEFVDFLSTNSYANSQSEFLSPLVIERCCWFWRRWTATYWLRSSKSSEWNDVFCSFGDEISKILITITKILETNIKCWSSESSITLETSKLVLGLSKTSQIRQTICLFPPFVNIIQYLTLPSWPVKHKTLFCKGMFRIFTSFNSDLESRSTVMKCCAILEGPVAAHLQDPNFASIAQNANVVEDVISFMHSIRGIALSSTPSNTPIIHGAIQQYFDVIIRLMQVYNSNDEIVLAIMKVLADVVDAQISYLETEQCNRLYRVIMEIFNIYSRHNFGRKVSGLGNALSKELEATYAREIATLLRLLENTMFREFADFQEVKINPPESEMSVAEVIFFGIHMILPLINTQLLQYRKVCDKFFSIVTCALEIYPERVAILPPELFNGIISSIEFGLQMKDPEPVMRCMESISGLARYAFVSRKADGTNGLQAQLQTKPNLFSSMLHFLLSHMLFKDFSEEVNDTASDAVFLLICCEQAAFQTISAQLIQQQPTPAFQQRLTAAFAALMDVGQFDAKNERQGRMKFRTNMMRFLIEVRSFLNYK